MDFTEWKGHFAVVAHWLSPQLKLEYALLVLREIDGSHSGEHIAETVYQAINEFDLSQNLSVLLLQITP